MSDIFTYSAVYPYTTSVHVIGSNIINITDIELDIVPNGTLTYSSASTTLVQAIPSPQQLPVDALRGTYINMSLINAIIKVDDKIVLGGDVESIDQFMFATLATVIAVAVHAVILLSRNKLR